MIERSLRWPRRVLILLAFGAMAFKGDACICGGNKRPPPNPPQPQTAAPTETTPTPPSPPPT